MSLGRFPMRKALACAVVTVSAPAVAVQTPHSCGGDPHVQCATYDANQSYRVATEAGRAVFIQFEPGEKVIDHGAGIGDTKAWSLGMTDSGALLKPRAQQPETNFLIVTNRRVYAISLADATAAQPATWVLRFDYPDTREKAASAQLRRQQAVTAALAGATGSPMPRASMPGGRAAFLATLQAVGNPGTQVAPVAVANASNMQYMMRGDHALAPTVLWDDGRFTYFKYSTTRDLPTIFTKLPDGDEATVNYHMEGDTIVVHEVSREFVIRYGQSVLGIRNDGYSPDGHSDASGSSLPGTARLTRERDASFNPSSPGN
ncbi:TrbG/VirB9 family P-type conjugative transfer protein [Paraburkholderia sp. Ac-20340]|uniref:TrbG/VirB9 family P-type conjugative transfer protein n=1 Tax=Paraburkholderia sp. Ac-20340 TaxID=2703888 RepID=UPI001981281E|nr:TrbG/VirB9 family P-type conjugative transfer protein [Paraburkholderia sp. Ac-20340]MBN3856773.1 TrbG/VirB9 family P-type conjugative transfer protein [Paraburkholderia sp. Ac-20340]